MIGRRAACLTLIVSLATAMIGGCGGVGKSAGSAGSPAPSLDSPNADERAAAAREAGKKYGAQP